MLDNYSTSVEWTKKMDTGLIAVVMIVVGFGGLIGMFLVNALKGMK